MAKKIIKHKNLSNIQDLAIRQEIQFMARQIEDYISTSATDNPESVTKVIQQSVTNISGGGGGGTSDHAALSNLDYSIAGHTGFESLADINNYKRLFWMGFSV